MIAPGVFDASFKESSDIYNDFAKDFNEAAEVLKARLADIRPGENAESLKAEILGPIQDKWNTLLGRNSAVPHSRMSELPSPRTGRAQYSAPIVGSEGEMFQADLGTGVARPITEPLTPQQTQLQGTRDTMLARNPYLGAQGMAPGFSFVGQSGQENAARGAYAADLESQRAELPSPQVGKQVVKPERPLSDAQEQITSRALTMNTLADLQRQRRELAKAQDSILVSAARAKAKANKKLSTMEQSIVDEAADREAQMKQIDAQLGEIRKTTGGATSFVRDPKTGKFVLQK